MKFINKCEDLIRREQKNFIKRKNGTILLQAPGDSKVRHVLYYPLKEKYMKDYLIDLYKNTVPKEYIKVLQSFNGMDLFKVNIKVNETINLSYSRLTIFGVALISPSNRKKDEEEPMDIRTLDVERNKSIPDTWMKIGSYVKDVRNQTICDIFVDTKSEKTYTCIMKTGIIECEWNSIDECLCELYDSLESTQWEYKV